MFDNIIKSLSPESQSGVDPEEASVKAARHPEVMDASHTVLSVLSSVHGATAEQPQTTNANQAAASETIYIEAPDQTVRGANHGAVAEQPQATGANQAIASETMYVEPPNQIVQGSNANPFFLQQARRDTENALNQEPANG
jgi:hypothetical protein